MIEAGEIIAIHITARASALPGGLINSEADCLGSNSMSDQPCKCRRFIKLNKLSFLICKMVRVILHLPHRVVVRSK